MTYIPPELEVKINDDNNNEIGIIIFDKNSIYFHFDRVYEYFRALKIDGLRWVDSTPIPAN